MNRRKFMATTGIGITGLTLLKWSQATGQSMFFTSGRYPTGTAPGNRLFPYYKNKPVSYFSVKLQDKFWRPRQESLLFSLDSFTAHVDEKYGGFKGFREHPKDYNPGKLQLTPHLEPVKFLESINTVAGLEHNSDLNKFSAKWAEYFRSFQMEDGYFGFGAYIKTAHSPENRWKNEWASHETYQMGHYIEGAISAMEATNDSLTFDSAIRCANFIAEEMLDRGKDFTPGHEEITQALMRLYNNTGNPRYLNLAHYFIKKRGHHEKRPPFGSGEGRYSQDHLPVEEQRTIEGHAVRAAFFYNGVTEYIGATGNEDFKKTVVAVWEDFKNRKMYLHGGGGCESANNEGYLPAPYKIAPDDAYAETCSVYGNFRWAHNLFRLTGEASYLDTAERMLYNAMYASLSLKGDTFFYQNPAEANKLTERNEWHTCPCCPPNIVTLFAKIGGYFYSCDNDGIYIKHYGTSSADIPFGHGMKILQHANYPWEGKIKIEMTPKQANQQCILRLRLPEWSENHHLSVNGIPVSLSPHKGWLEIDRKWNKGDVIELEMEMSVRKVHMSQEFTDYNGLVAFQRGPIVYCLEDKDVDASVSSVYLPEKNVFRATHKKDLLGGVTVLEGSFIQPQADGSDKMVSATLIPYGVWANRGATHMKMWFPEKREFLKLY